ncbi:hypothetical protein NNC19_21315 [Clostridium sp. SHJSY1]|uniref:hypothetical protein n=1 Tax=Clostridium sp. SHJSY1 TaxID=2942483 RepID=UPI002875B79D|nr:hypothetical protein [Clostridium sp. SHJSY1]MDS0528230.1 hypothetical protein [Clostridium sp. SHJSY1]
MDKLVIKAQKDKRIHDKLIAENEFFITKIASRGFNRYITKSDYEWAIALNAFNETVKNYKLEKGSFYSLAKLIIKRRIVDYLGKGSGHKSEMQANLYSFKSNIWDKTENELIKFR